VLVYAGLLEPTFSVPGACLRPTGDPRGGVVGSDSLPSISGEIEPPGSFEAAHFTTGAYRSFDRLPVIRSR
jgi:hypothetical protein